MRRILYTGIAAIAMTSLLAACGGSSDDKSSDSKSSDGASATSKSSGTKGTKDCLVGTWSATAEALDLFEAEPGDSATYSTPTGKVKFTFTENGNFTYFFDNVGTIVTEGGESSNLNLNGSVGGTYTVNEGTFKTDTSKFNISISVDDVQIPVSDTVSFQESLKEGDKQSQGFTCTSSSITVKDDEGGSFTLNKA